MTKRSPEIILQNLKAVELTNTHKGRTVPRKEKRTKNSELKLIQTCDKLERPVRQLFLFL